MANKIQRWPAWAKVFVYFLILWLGTLLAGALPLLNGIWFFLSLSLLVVLLFTGSFRKTVMETGMLPLNRKHLLQLTSGTITGICTLLTVTACTFWLTGDRWQFNVLPPLPLILIVFLTCLWSAYAQEVVFRGFPFQQLLHRYGPWRAQLIIAIPFGLMHIKDNMAYEQIFIILLTTGLGSILFGLAYIKTRNLMLPTGLHFGWNFAEVLVPRTSGAGSATSLISVDGNAANYTFINIICPYLVVITVVILAMHVIYNRSFGRLSSSATPV